MGRIRVRVSQGGGTEGLVADFGSGQIFVGLTSEDTNPVPPNMQVTLTVGTQVVGSKNTPSSATTSVSLTYPYTGNAVGLSYNVTASNPPQGTNFDGQNGTVATAPAIATEAARVSVPAPATGSKSFFQKFRSFFSRLFGLKTT